MNSGFALQQASFLAERLQREAGSDRAAQADRAFRLMFGREPSPEESAQSVTLIREHGLLVLCRALFNANEFITIY